MVLTKKDIQADKDCLMIIQTLKGMHHNHPWVTETMLRLCLDEPERFYHNYLKVRLQDLLEQKCLKFRIQKQKKRKGKVGQIREYKLVKEEFDTGKRGFINITVKVPIHLYEKMRTYGEKWDMSVHGIFIDAAQKMVSRGGYKLRAERIAREVAAQEEKSPW